MHDGRTRLAHDVEREVREHFPELVFDTVDPAQRARSARRRASACRSPGTPRSSAGSAAYLKLAKEVAARG